MILQEYHKGVSWDQLRINIMWPYRTWVSLPKATSTPSWPSSWQKAKTGETAPVQTLSGFQLVQVVDRKDAKTRSFQSIPPDPGNAAAPGDGEDLQGMDKRPAG